MRPPATPTPNTATAHSSVRPTRRVTGRAASAIAIMFTGLTVALVTGVPLGTFIGQHFGWRETFLAVSALGVLAFVGSMLFVPRDVHHSAPATLRQQLAVLGQPRLLLVSNPVFGLDFAAVHEIHARIMAVRNRGGAVLLVSEDLDELLELADRIVVMSEGRIVHECPAEGADRRVLGAFMGGHAHETPTEELAA